MSLEGIVGSNYINANFVDGYAKSCAYIATQAPLMQTLADFWRMVWETKSRIVIMLTNLNERGRVSVSCFDLVAFFTVFVHCLQRSSLKWLFV